MTQRRRFTLMPGAFGTYSPTHQPHPPVQRTLGHYFSLVIWRSLMQEASRYRYWIWAAAIAYGLGFCLLLGFFVLLAAAT
ncbi:MAG: hypothetical protein F6K42_11045, partial [Leptolyngbya sp. SIO1D8]|nr:hypothetical protein [Leptolyngbya sp. SIO1D8]